MISFGWLDKLLNINNNPIKVQFFDPITGEEAVVISKRLLRDTIREAYEAGAEEQCRNVDGLFFTIEIEEKDKYINDVCEELHL